MAVGNDLLAVLCAQREGSGVNHAARLAADLVSVSRSRIAGDAKSAGTEGDSHTSTHCLCPSLRLKKMRAHPPSAQSWLSLLSGTATELNSRVEFQAGYRIARIVCVEKPHCAARLCDNVIVRNTSDE